MIIILDAAALINNENFTFDKKNKYCTTNLVIEEWKDYRTKALAENAIKNKMLKIRDPKEKAIEKAKKECEKTGTILQKADISVLALAIELTEKKHKPIIMTDDYSLQNCLKTLKIEYTPIAQTGIKKTKKFKTT
ncbi:MAG: hypothetical protein QXZ13_00300 [Candidatus Diapherotrites archaeon]